MTNTENSNKQKYTPEQIKAAQALRAKQLQMQQQKKQAATSQPTKNDGQPKPKYTQEQIKAAQLARAKQLQTQKQKASETKTNPNQNMNKANQKYTPEQIKAAQLMRAKQLREQQKQANTSTPISDQTTVPGKRNYTPEQIEAAKRLKEKQPQAQQKAPRNMESTDADADLDALFQLETTGDASYPKEVTTDPNDVIIPKKYLMKEEKEEIQTKKENFFTKFIKKFQKTTTTEEAPAEKFNPYQMTSTDNQQQQEPNEENQEKNEEEQTQTPPPPPLKKDADIEEDEEDTPKTAEWIVTFGDMITLLLCFFILLFAMSDIKLDKIKAMVSSMESSYFGIQNVRESWQRLGIEAVTETGEEQSIEYVDELGGNLNEDMANIQLETHQLILYNNLGGAVKCKVDERGAVITITDQILFSPGNAALKKEGFKFLNQVMTLIGKFHYFIRVEGHTDNVEKPNARFRSNWDLSCARAAQIAQYFVNKGLKPDRFMIEGFAGYKPVTSNATAEGRQQNRRVEVVILRESPKSRWKQPFEETD